jgi:tetratricopeptide (TPR) repeat protein
MYPVSRTEATVEELLALVPELDEMELLRLRVIAAAIPDPGREWDSSSAYSTVDKRIVTADDVERSIRDAEESLRQYITMLYEGLRPVFRTFFEGRGDEAASHLVSLGEKMEGEGRLKGARQCYRAALTLSLPLLDKQPQILALRRIGRVALNLGDFQEASQHYERSAQLARDADNLRGEVVARTGMGNVLAWQGRWADAERTYREALSLAEGAPEGDFALELAQIFYNLGHLATRMERLEESEEWLARAFERANAAGSPVDLSFCYMNLGHLREKQGRLEEARDAYDRARSLPVSRALLSGIASDMADVCLREGHVSQAEEWGRIAEEHAIAAGSAYILGRMYQSRGNIARAQGDEDGFTFYEKALEIAREKAYPFLEAETLADYAELRRRSGGLEEAQAYLERARDLFQELGAAREVARMEAALEKTRLHVPAFAPEPEEPEQLAAAGD